MQSINQIQNIIASEVIYSTCRNLMEDIEYVDAIDASEKVRVCYQRFYKLNMINTKFFLDFKKTKNLTS